MGIMILPLVCSMSEDALNAVPNALREAAYGLGATKLETAVSGGAGGAFRNHRRFHHRGLPRGGRDDDRGIGGRIRPQLHF